MSGLRSALFGAWFYLVTTVLAVAFAALLPFPRAAIMGGLRLWARLIVLGLKVFVGVRIEVRGLEHRPTGAALIASKHQGWFDAMGPFTFLPDACFVLKQELLRIPFWGWEAGKAEMIPIDRDAHAQAVRDLVAAARRRLGDGRQVIIFPEGTRRAPGAAPAYKPGVAAIYRELEVPCTPMATNSGVHWPADALPSRPGVIVFEFLAPIPAGLKRAEFMRELQERIEMASDALLAEGI